ncbi:MAG: hypothetical protein M1138_04555 [Candidatus Thermoplasmatota archaeon]|jgi:hypothetical protein|nr:hypothetical protein [Candidatus Thermoplasmatota archaeon]
MNSFVVGIDPGEKESNECYISPDVEIGGGLKFPVNRDIYTLNSRIFTTINF